MNHTKVSNTRWNAHWISLAIISVLLGLGIRPAFAGGGGVPAYVPEQIVAELIPGRDIDDVNSRWGTTTIDSFGDGTVHLLSAIGLGNIPDLAIQMTNDPDMIEAEPNFLEDTPEGIRHTVLVSIGGDLTDYEDQSMTGRIGLGDAHDITRGLGVVVAILDTGIDPDHEIFQGRIAPGGYDFVDEDFEPWEEANGVDDDNDNQVDDGYGHGTMVAGLVHLVAPDAFILPLRVLDDEGRSDTYRIARAVRYARDAGVDVINMSFGSPEGASVLQSEFGRADDDEIVLVSGAGNENREEPAFYPGKSSKVIMVAALDSTDVKTSFSDWNQDVHVSAPGDGVRSAYPGGEWAYGAGCSFATPLVSGEAALILALRPHFFADDVQDQIEVSVDPIYHLPGNQPYDEGLGSGRINVFSAISALNTSSTPPIDAGAKPMQAFPNPTTGGIQFSGVSPTSSGIVILDIQGREVTTIPSGQFNWDGLDTHGAAAPAGIYFYRELGSPGETSDSATGRFVLVR